MAHTTIPYPTPAILLVEALAPGQPTAADKYLSQLKSAGLQFLRPGEEVTLGQVVHLYAPRTTSFRVGDKPPVEGDEAWAYEQEPLKLIAKGGLKYRLVRVTEKVPY